MTFRYCDKCLYICLFIITADVSLNVSQHLVLVRTISVMKKADQTQEPESSQSGDLLAAIFTLIFTFFSPSGFVSTFDKHAHIQPPHTHTHTHTH